ncbi:MAG: hypothetical protein PHY00_01690 [Bacilli bacterium]|nr:hypothetical protein [Bacilli bacterium]
MMITIGYLYYDLLNLYGENGNIKALKKQLENQGIKTVVKFLTIDDDLEFNKYDFIYIGAGTENNQKIALKHLLKYKDDIKDYIESNKLFLSTGNSIELFGKSILDNNKKKIKTLGIFKYQTLIEDFRMIDEAVFKSNLFDEPFVGFQNQYGVIKNIKEPFFKVIKGIGSYPNSTTEGINYKNFYGTYLIGPILIRNPHFLKYIVKELVLSKDKKFKFKKFNLKLETTAHDKFLEKYYSEISI